MAQVALRITAGWNYDEIAEHLDDARPELQYLPLPRKVTKAWVSARFRELRREIENFDQAA